VFVCFVDIGGIVDHQYLINIREYRKGQSKQDNPKKQDEKKQNKNTTQYVLDNTMYKQTQIT
jgi:hypothetical protein